MTEFQQVRLSDCTTVTATPQGQPLRYVVGTAQMTLWDLEMELLAVAGVHSHAATDTILITTADSGPGLTLLGEELAPILHDPDEAFVIPAGMLHVGISLSAEHPYRLREVRTDTPDRPDVHLAPWLQERAVELARRAQRAHAGGQDPVAAITRSQA